jgi:hypothetical protein
VKLGGGTVLKVAITLAAAFIVTWHVPVPEQPAPDQPAKPEPVAAVAVKVTCVPFVKSCEQVEPQLIPAGELVTVPDPLPALETLRVEEVAEVATNP